MFTVSDFSFRSLTKVVLHFSIVFPTHSIPPQDETSVQNWVSWGSGNALSPNGALKFRDWILAIDFLGILIDRFCTSAQYITGIATSYNEKTVYIIRNIKYDTIYQEHFLYNNKKLKKRKLIIFSQFSETTFHHSCAHKISCASNLWVTLTSPHMYAIHH